MELRVPPKTPSIVHSSITRHSSNDSLYHLVTYKFAEGIRNFIHVENSVYFTAKVKVKKILSSSKFVQLISPLTLYTNKIVINTIMIKFMKLFNIQLLSLK